MTFLLWPKYDQKFQGGTSRKIGWGCVACFLKPLPYFRPKSVIFPTLFQTGSKNGWKTITFGLAHTFIAYIRDYPPPPPNSVTLKMRCRLWVSLLTQLEPMREKTSLVNDWLSPNSLILVRKATGDELVFLWQKVLERLWNSLDNMSKDVPTNFVLLWDPYEKSQDKNDMSINLKKLAVDICIHWFHFYFPVSDTRWQKFSISQLCTMSPMLRNTMAGRNTFSSRTETRILNLYIKVILLSHFRSV